MEWKIIHIVSQLVIICVYLFLSIFKKELRKKANEMLYLAAILTGCFGVVVYFLDTPSLLGWCAICVNVVLVITNAYYFRRELVKK